MHYFNASVPSFEVPSRAFRHDDPRFFRNEYLPMVTPLINKFVDSELAKKRGN